jgi:hypothetical protein
LLTLHGKDSEALCGFVTNTLAQENLGLIPGRAKVLEGFNLKISTADRASPASMT